MLAKIKQFVKNRDQRSWTKVKMKAKAFIDQNLADIILIIGVILISLLSFAAGYITAKQQEKEPIRIEVDEDSFISTFIFVNKNLVYDNSNYWSGHYWPLSVLETFGERA